MKMKWCRWQWQWSYDDDENLLQEPTVCNNLSVIMIKIKMKDNDEDDNDHQSSMFCKCRSQQFVTISTGPMIIWTQQCEDLINCFVSSWKIIKNAMIIDQQTSWSFAGLISRNVGLFRISTSCGTAMCIGPGSCSSTSDVLHSKYKMYCILNIRCNVIRSLIISAMIQSVPWGQYSIHLGAKGFLRTNCCIAMHCIGMGGSPSEGQEISCVRRQKRLRPAWVELPPTPPP